MFFIRLPKLSSVPGLLALNFIKSLYDPFFNFLSMLTRLHRNDSYLTRSIFLIHVLCEEESSKVSSTISVLHHHTFLLSFLALLTGLATYNILQNPRYKEAFNISDGFALSHGRVKSLRNFGVRFLSHISSPSHIVFVSVFSSPVTIFRESLSKEWLS
jgi:hypothetical protein